MTLLLSSSSSITCRPYDMYVSRALRTYRCRERGGEGKEEEGNGWETTGKGDKGNGRKRKGGGAKRRKERGRKSKARDTYITCTLRLMSVVDRDRTCAKLRTQGRSHWARRRRVCLKIEIHEIHEIHKIYEIQLPKYRNPQSPQNPHKLDVG